MVRLFLAALLFIGAYPALANDQADALSDIEANCKAEWATDDSMQEYCIGRQIDAIDAVAKIHKSSLSVAEKDMLNQCLSQWTKDWSMVNYCYTKQHDAYVRLQEIEHR
ncbi:hypothetical protein BPNPMPFG_006321 [Mesorhizobium sp. AR07]|uniref:hypothetical protein n=1 Tax=Mesorhizobium sp. AR07 TaxID=2865838 RepID=UPI00215FFF57|nr:hypothetical protein [Mesorhizobium sp. AR07]UVK44404.1 hypothetical protein BPNPMPFG_006321 [Mesorhizobium sp. AR07]